MKIYYPTYYLVPVIPVMSLDDEEYNLPGNDEYGHGVSSGGNQVYNTYRNMNEDIFEDVDEEYVNDSTK